MNFSICTSKCIVWPFMFVFLLTTLKSHFIYHLVCQFDLNSQNVHWISTVMATKSTKNVLKQQKNPVQKHVFYISIQNATQFVTFCKLSKQTKSSVTTETAQSMYWQKLESVGYTFVTDSISEFDAVDCRSWHFVCNNTHRQ